MWEKGRVSATTMQYNQYKEEQVKLMTDSTCFCLPLRSGVLAIGLIGSTLAISGMAAYAIVQVPTIRLQVGQYFISTNTPDKQDMVLADNFNIRNIAYNAEVVGVLIGASIGLLVNILLIFGVLWRRRWFLMHWLLFHLLVLILLFIICILLFIVQSSLWKLMGIIPVMGAIFTMYCWAKVYELFCSLRPLFDNYPEHQPCELHPHAPQHMHPDMHHHHHTQWVEEEEEMDDREASVDKMGEMERMGLGVEFYPVDPLSRGMVDRLKELNMSLSNMGYLPFEDMSDSQYLRTSQSSEKLQYLSEEERHASAKKMSPGRENGANKLTTQEI